MLPSPACGRGEAQRAIRSLLMTAFGSSTPGLLLAGFDISRDRRAASDQYREALHTGHRRSRCPVLGEQRSRTRNATSRRNLVVTPHNRHSDSSANRQRDRSSDTQFFITRPLNALSAGCSERCPTRAKICRYMVQVGPAPTAARDCASRRCCRADGVRPGRPRTPRVR